MKRVLAARAADAFVLASNEKIGTASPFQVLPLSEVAALIVDGRADPNALEQLRRSETALIQAD